MNQPLIKKPILLFLIILIVAFLFFSAMLFKNMEEENVFNNDSQIIDLPEPGYSSDISLEEAMLKRRSVRDYQKEPLGLKEVSQILWSAQGITDRERNLRTAPSAGALYPLEVYLVVGEIEDIVPGVYHYNSYQHQLKKTLDGDKREELSRAALGQGWVKDAPAVLVFAAVYERTTAKYGERGIRYVHMEAGHAAQNAYLQATALGLGAVVVGAFKDEEVKGVLNVKEEPLYIMPMGKIKK